MNELFPYGAISSAFAGSVVYPPGGHYGPRVQSDIQFVLLHTGNIQLELDDKELQFDVGQIFILKPGHREKLVF